MPTNSFVRLNNHQQNNLISRLEQAYGFNFHPLMASQQLDLWIRGSNIYAFPELYWEFFPGLPFQSLGMLVGNETPAGFNPSHEFVTRFGSQFTLGRFILPADLLEVWVAGEDLRPAPASIYPAGFQVVVFDEKNRLLGRGKILKDRIKNLLPKRLF